MANEQNIQNEPIRRQFTEQELREGTAGFDRIFGENAFDFVKNSRENVSAGDATPRRLSTPELEQRFSDIHNVPLEEVHASLEAQKNDYNTEEDHEEEDQDLVDADEWNKERGFTSMPRDRANLVAQTINESQENGDLRVGTDQQIVVANETNEVVEKPTENELKSAMAARSALETERENILTEAQTPHEVGLDGALKSYVNGRADAYNNIRNALAESSAVELPKLIEPEEINVAPPTLAIDNRQQSLSLAL